MGSMLPIFRQARAQGGCVTGVVVFEVFFWDCLGCFFGFVGGLDVFSLDVFS